MPLPSHQNSERGPLGVGADTLVPHSKRPNGVWENVIRHFKDIKCSGIYSIMWDMRLNTGWISLLLCTAWCTISSKKIGVWSLSLYVVCSHTFCSLILQMDHWINDPKIPLYLYWGFSTFQMPGLLLWLITRGCWEGRWCKSLNLVFFFSSPFCPGVIYLKNMITQHWSDADVSGTETPVNNIPEEDRQFIRDSIVEAIIHSPERIR